MFVFFEESSDFKIGKVLQHQGDSSQVELNSGRRVKVKKSQVLLELTKSINDDELARIIELAKNIDLDLLWETVGDEPFFFNDMTAQYFGETFTESDSLATFYSLQNAPMYFRRKGRGQFMRAPEDQLKAAKEAEVRKAEKLAQQKVLQAQLVAGEIPEEIAQQIIQLLISPDKNSIVYQVLERSCQELKTTIERYCLEHHLISSIRQILEMRFTHRFFPKGTSFPHLPEPQIDIKRLKAFKMPVFSIDDSATTEIDDALSVEWFAADHIQVGIHIACPGLGVQRNDAVDQVARQRLSTVYFPTDKITMLPNEWVQHFSLNEGATVPALTLLVDINPTTWELRQPPVTQLSLVKVAANLRYDQLDEQVTKEHLAEKTGEYPFKLEIECLWEWACHLRQQREIKRGKLERNQQDYLFRVSDQRDEQGEFLVDIVPRMRGAPLDMIVSELMVFTNSYWATWMHELQVPAIFRVQKAFGPNRTRSQTQAAPHDGLGVDAYAWCTSPLRRYTDLVNQWQLIACVDQGVAARLAAPFKPKEADLYSIVSDFDATYASYADFQSEMERYWCLKWLEQQKKDRVKANCTRENTYRLIEIPLVINVMGRQDDKGQVVELQLGRIDWATLDIEVLSVQTVVSAE